MSAVSGVSVNLSYLRLENDRFYLTCTVQNGSIAPELLQFWINDTDLDITNKSDRISSNIVAFDLEQRYEGTFYCGEIDGVHSDGLGPFAGK